MKLKEKLNDFYDKINRIYNFINEKNKHPLRNAWIFTQITILPSIYSQFNLKSISGIEYGLCQCGIITFLHFIDEWLVKPRSYQTTLDNYLSDT